VEKLLSRDLSWVPARSYYTNIAEGTLRTIWRRRGLVIGAVAASVVVAGIALSVMNKKYTADALVQLDLGRRETALVNEQPPTVMLEATSIIQGEAKIIRSRLMARRVVEKLGLGETASHEPSESSVGGLFDALLAMPQRFVGQIGFSASPSDESPRQSSAVDQVIRTVMSRLTVETDNRSYLITIGYTSNNATEAARIANAYAEEYLLRHRELSSHLANHVIEWLSSQIRVATAAQQEADEALAAFRKRTGLLDVGPNGENVQQQQLRDLNAQLSAASLARLNEENRLTRVRRVIAAGGTPSAADLQGIPLIQSLATQEAAARKELSELTASLGPGHPNVARAQAALSQLRGSLRTAMGQAVSTIEADVAAAMRAEKDLKAQLEILQRTIVGSKTNEAELQDLQAHARTARERVASLTRSYDQAVAAHNLAPTTSSLITPADPVSTPSSPKPFVVLSMGLLGGLGLGVAAALLNEKRDRGFRTSGEVAALTGIRCLGMLPELAQCERRKKDALSTERVIFAEAIRTVGAGVGLFGTAGNCRVVLVTSSLPGEGKSTICMSLARSLAGVGQRVLLIDSTRSREASVPMLLLAPAEDEPTRVLHRVSTVAAEVFGPKLDRLIDDARRQFDVIIVEGAPLMLLADSFVIGRQADAVIHVIHWQKTRKTTVLSVLQRLQDQAVRVDGTVLARVVPREHRKLGLEDECSHYSDARSFYESLSGGAPPTVLLPEPSTSRAA
jgi:polysaccharide biosynthesis transport protein